MPARSFSHPVLNALAAYGAAAFVLLQAADLFLPALLFPEWVFRFLVILALIGVPITAIVAVALTQPKTGRAVRSRWTPARRRLAAGLILLGASASGSAAFVTVKPETIDFKDRDWLIIADCASDSKEPGLTRAVTDALSYALRESRFANVFPRNRLGEALARMQRDPKELMTRDLALQLAQREGAAGVVTCDVSQDASGTIINAGIVNPQTAELAWSHAATARSREDVVETIEGVARELRGALGESRAGLWREARGLARVTTPSIDALKMYTAAIRAWGEGKYPEAVELHHSAIKIDSQFARAHAALGYYYYWTGDRARGEPHLQNAERFASNVTERERLWLSAYIKEARGDREGAAASFRSYLVAYPTDREAWYNLGTDLMMLSRCTEAVAAFERALAIDSLFNTAEINLGTCYSRDRNYPKALHHLERVRTRQPSWFLTGNLNHELGLVYLSVGQPERALQVFEQRLTENPLEAAGARRSIGLLNAHNGKYQAALRDLREAAQLARAAGSPLSELRNRLYVTALLERLGNTAEAKQELSRIDAIVQQSKPEPWWLLLTARRHLASGQVERARALWKQMQPAVRADNNDDVVASGILEGEFLLRDGKQTEAIDRLELMYARKSDVYTRDPLAKAHLAAGNTDRAVKLFELSIAEGGGLWEGQEPWFDAHHELARIAEMRGDTAKAVQAYARLLELWKGADSEFPDLLQARSRVRALSRNADIGRER